MDGIVPHISDCLPGARGALGADSESGLVSLLRGEAEPFSPEYFADDAPFRAAGRVDTDGRRGAGDFAGLLLGGIVDR